MQSFKKFVYSFLIVTCLIAIALAGCSKKPNDPTSPSDPDHPHSFGQWQVDHQNHWKVCSCQKRGDEGAHVDADANGKCDLCDYATPPKGTTLASANELKNITALKTASAGGAITAHPGGRITYQISLTNKNANTVSVTVSDTLPENTVLISGCENISGNILSWYVNAIAPGETVSITYTVSPDYTVQQIRKSATDIILKNTDAKVMDKVIAAPDKDIWVLETFNATDRRRIEMAIDALVTANLTAYNSSYQELNGVALASMMYTVGFSSGLGISTDLSEILSLVYSSTDKLQDRVVPTLFGGTAVPASKDQLFRGARAAAVTIDDLISGDLILTNKNGSTKLYIVDGTDLVELGRTEVITNVDPATVLPGLPASDKYVVLRPSINLATSYSLEDDEYFNEYDKGPYTELEKALIATAEAYLLRGDRTQYDDYRMSTKEYRLESLVRQPEDYTTDQYGYLDCSHFTYDIHWATYGYAAKATTASGSTVSYATCKNMLDCIQNGWNYTALTGSNPSAVYFYMPTRSETDAEKEAIYQDFVSRLRPGDIVTYRYLGETGGHAMLYIGRGLLIHCTGSTYNAAKNTDAHEAGIRFMNVDDLFDVDVNAKRYMFVHARFGIVRPQNLTTPEITENTANRVANMQGVVAEKITSTAMGKTVNPGDTITYTFYIFNTNQEAKQFTIKDILGEYVTFVSATENGVCNNSEVSWNLTVPADTRVSVSYTVRVKDGVAAYTAIDGSKATINGVVHKCLDTYVANTLTLEQQQALIEAVNTIRSTDTTNLDTVQIANLIYKTAFGADNIFGDDVDTLDKLLGIYAIDGVSQENKGVFNYSKNGYVTIMDSNPSKGSMMVAPGMFGGYNVNISTSSGETYNRYLNLVDKTLRSRYYWEKDLIVGDIYILCGSSTSVYIYIGNDTFVSLTSMNVFSATSRLHYAHEREAYQYHVVLRPSIANENI